MSRREHDNLIPADLAFYASPPHECSYFAEREAVTLFADPYAPMSSALYGELLRHGFRRSGSYVYRPRCPGCSACISTRIPVRAFRPNRSQRRCARDNADLQVRVRPAAFDAEQYALYTRYIRHRHPGGGMDVDDPERYLDFLASDWCETHFVEFRDGERLLAVAVVDVLAPGLSAVYTFFDPAAAPRGLGTYAVLWQIEEARRRGLPHVYLGYWIADHEKMAYKARYRPLEALVMGAWQPLIIKR